MRSAGFEPGRHSFLMVADLPDGLPEPALPDGRDGRGLRPRDVRGAARWPTTPPSPTTRTSPGSPPSSGACSWSPRPTPATRCRSWPATPSGAVAAYVFAHEYAVPPSGGAGPEIHVPYVGTLPDHRGRGLATALLSRVLHLSRGAGYVTASLNVDTANPTGALGIYERAGFRQSYRQDSYHLDGVGARLSRRSPPPGRRGRGCRARRRARPRRAPLQPVRAHRLAVAGHAPARAGGRARPRPTPAPRPGRRSRATTTRRPRARAGRPGSTGWVSAQSSASQSHRASGSPTAPPAARQDGSTVAARPGSPRQPCSSSSQCTTLRRSATAAASALRQRGLARAGGPSMHDEAPGPRVGGAASTRSATLRARPRAGSDAVRRHGRSRGRTGPPR